jgi:hypothetical protein
MVSFNIGLTDSLWNLMKRGWAAEPDRRPTLANFQDTVTEDLVRSRELATARREERLCRLERALNIRNVQKSAPPVSPEGLSSLPAGLPDQSDGLLSRHRPRSRLRPALAQAQAVLPGTTPGRSPVSTSS